MSASTMAGDRHPVAAEAQPHHAPLRGQIDLLQRRIDALDRIGIERRLDDDNASAGRARGSAVSSRSFIGSRTQADPGIEQGQQRRRR